VEEKEGIEGLRDLMKRNYTPKAICCYRFRGHISQKTTYDAEVSYRGEHYVVKTRCETLKEAEAEAQKVVDAILIEFESTAMKRLSHLPKAKP
jgi:hypothetical protein